MSTAEIAVRENGYAALAERDVVDGWLAVVSDVIKLAGVVAPTEFVPSEYRDNPPAIAAAILVGRELGIGPMTSLRHVQVVKGTPTLSAEYKRARVLAAGHEFDILELNTTRCRVAGRRRGSNKPPLEITFTMDDAKRAGLLAPSRSGKPGAWQTRPRRMLFARAGSELCDFLFADVVNGLPTAELVADGVEGDEFAGYDEAPAQESPRPAQRTAQRRRQPVRSTLEQGPADRPTPAAPAAATAPTAAPATGQTAPSGLPPLPGEDEEPGPTVAAHAAPAATGSTPDPGHSAAAAPGEPPAQPPFDPDQHGTATRGKGGQLTAIWTIFGDVYGFQADEKDKARGVVEHIIGRKLDGETTGDLAYNEAKAVIDTLASWQKIAEARKEHPRDVMIAVLVESGKVVPGE